MKTILGQIVSAVASSYSLNSLDAAEDGYISGSLDNNLSGIHATEQPADNAAHDLVEDTHLDRSSTKGSEKGPLPDLGETFPYEVFLQDLPSPEGLNQFLEPNQPGHSPQPSLMEKTTGQLHNDEAFHLNLRQTHVPNQAPHVKQTQFNNNQLPHNLHCQQNRVLYPTVLSLDSLANAPLNVASANYGDMTYAFPPTNTGMNISRSSTLLDEFYTSIGSKRSRDEVLQNNAKRPRTFGELQLHLDYNNDARDICDRNADNDGNTYDDGKDNDGGNANDEGKENVHNKNVVDKPSLGVTICTNVHNGYVYKYVMVEKPISCPKCNMQLATNEDMIQHMKRSHKEGNEGGSNNQNTNVVCDVCKIMLANHTNLHRHIQTVHKGGERKECSECEAWFSTQTSLTRHKKEAHGILSRNKPKTRPRKAKRSGVVEIGKDKLKVYVCGCCDKVLYAKGNMTRHIGLTHIEKRPFICEICKRTFKTKSNMQSHQSSRRCVPRGEVDGSNGEV